MRLAFLLLNSLLFLIGVLLASHLHRIHERRTGKKAGGFVMLPSHPTAPEWSDFGFLFGFLAGMIGRSVSSKGTLTPLEYWLLVGQANLFAIGVLGMFRSLWRMRQERANEVIFTPYTVDPAQRSHKKAPSPSLRRGGDVVRD